MSRNSFDARSEPVESFRHRHEGKGARKMTVNDLVIAVLAFERVNGPIASVAYLMGPLAAALAVFYLSVKVAARLPGHKSFDIGGHFDHFYSRILPAARIGGVVLIYAGYFALWLSKWPIYPGYRLLHEPDGSVFYGVLATLIVVGLVATGSWYLAKAAWFALRWLRLEARGVRWHITDSGEPYRIMWVRRNGEYFYDPSVRELRLNDELTTLRARRVRLGTAAAIAVVAIIVWLRGQAFIGSFYSVLPAWAVLFLVNWALPLVFFFVAIPMTVAVIAALADELVYRSGAQYVTGAKVLEPGAWRVGRQSVEDQKAHGDAEFETAEEAVRRMFGPGKR
jgi:hypothetical protein